MPPHIDGLSPPPSFDAKSSDPPDASSDPGETSHPVGDSLLSPLSSTIAPVTSPMNSKNLLKPGVYVPTVCFFHPESQDVDTKAIARHAVRLARAGVAGLATQGSNGEAVHLSREERKLVTSTTRKALDAAGFADMPLITGCGCQSTRETIQLCRDARDSGADYALILPPSYYASTFAPEWETVKRYFTEVADSSPIPLIIYNFPAAAGGLDLSSDVIIDLSKHPMIVGAKFTCGNTGKLGRVADETQRMSGKQWHIDNETPPEFLVLAGSADFSIQSVIAGGHGILAGLANIAPKACVRTLELFWEDNIEEAQETQKIVSHGDWAAIQGGVVGLKAGMEAWLGYGGHARSPLPRPTEDQKKMYKEGFRRLMILENIIRGDGDGDTAGGPG